jgi:hypothetical protein
MKKILVFSFIIGIFSSCGFLQVNNAQPTLIVLGTSGTMSATSVGILNKELGLREHTFYDIGELSVSIKTSSIDTILKLILQKDSTIRIDVSEAFIKKTTHLRY